MSEIKSRIREISAYRRSRLGFHLAGGAIVTLLMLVGVTTGQQTTPSDSADALPDQSSRAARETAQRSEQPNQAADVDAASKIKTALPGATEEKERSPALQALENQLLGNWSWKSDCGWTGGYTFKADGVMEGRVKWDMSDNGKKLILTKTQSVDQALDYQILGTWNGDSDKGWKDVRTFEEKGAMEGGIQWFIIENKSFVVIKKKSGPGSYEEYQFPLQSGKLIGKNDLGETVTLAR